MAQIWIGKDPKEDKNKYKEIINDIASLARPIDDITDYFYGYAEYPLANFIKTEDCNTTYKFMSGWLGLECSDANMFNVLMNLIALEIPIYQVDFDTENETFGKNIMKMIDKITGEQIKWYVI